MTGIWRKNISIFSQVPIWLANRRLWKRYRRLFGWLTPDYRGTGNLYALPGIQGYFTSINLPDSLKRGESHFYAEVLRTKAYWKKSRKKMLISSYSTNSSGEQMPAMLMRLRSSFSICWKKYPQSKFLLSTPYHRTCGSLLYRKNMPVQLHGIWNKRRPFHL